MVISGKLLGIGLGTIVSFIGAMAAALIGYFGCKKGGNAFFTRLVGEEDVSRVQAWFERYGVLAIIISRPVPMLTEILSCMAGLSGMKLRTFLWASILGTLPICAVYAWAGAIGTADDPWLMVWVALLIPAIGYAITKYVKRAE
jgi:uncharacterized membrane protein YdjX (TVP38/TMEM64 family)